MDTDAFALADIETLCHRRAAPFEWDGFAPIVPFPHLTTPEDGPIDPWLFWPDGSSGRRPPSPPASGPKAWAN